MSYKQAMKHWGNHRKQRFYQPIVLGHFTEKPRPPKMMPGQEPYTPEELAQLDGLVADAAEAVERIEPDELERAPQTEGG